MEFIGLLVGTSILYGLAASAGLLLALLHYLFMRIRRKGRPASRLTLLFSALLPILALSYLLFCFGLNVAFGRATMFGDVREDLPNGYVLTALGKMPYDGTVERKGAISGVGCVGQIATQQCWIAGRYDDSHFPCSEEPKRQKLFFLLDSRSGTLTEYASVSELYAAIGLPVQLIATPHYHAPYTLLGQIARWVWVFLYLLGPSALTVLLVLLWRRDFASATSKQADGG